MKKKLLSILLLVALCFSSLTVVSTGAEGEAQNVDDVTILHETESFASTSSSSLTGWNGNYVASGAQTAITCKDPTDASNSIRFYGYKKAGANGPLRKTKNLSITTETVYSSDFLVPGTGDTYLAGTAYKVNLFGGNLLTLTQSDGDLYSVTLGGTMVGYYRAGSWSHFEFVYTPIAANESKATASMKLYFFGSSLYNQDMQSVVSLTSTSTLTTSNTTFEILVTMPSTISDNWYGWYLDNAYIYNPGSFYNNKVTLDSCGDLYGNYELEGNVTLSFQHAIDYSTWDRTLKLVDEEGTELPITSITYDPGHPYKIVLHMDGNPLPKYSNLKVVMSSSVKDTTGQNLTSYELPFETKGEEGEATPKLDVVEYSSEWVMPDAYNTGYRTTLTDIKEKYPDVVANNYTITEALAKKYNYVFSDFSATLPMITVNTENDVTFRDCFIECTSYYAFANKGTGTIHIEYMEGIKSLAAFFSTSNMVASHCHVHDCTADITKGNGHDITYEFCYFHDAGTRCPGAHADGMQFSGTSSSVMNNIKVIGCRFDMPTLQYDHLANCCYFFKPESNTAGYTNIQCIGNWFNGGGYTTYLTCSLIGPENNTYVTYAYNKTGNGWKFGPYNVSGWSKSGSGTDISVNLDVSGGSFHDNVITSTLDVGSIVYYDNGTTRVASIDEITSGSCKILLNFANYNLSEHGYKISYQLLDATGKIVTNDDVTGTIARYISPKEYDVASNQEQIDVDGTIVTQLINIPDFPVNVPVEIELSDLPQNMSGYSLAIIVEDTTQNAWIRSSELTSTIKENQLQTLPEGLTYSCTFLDKDGEQIAVQKVACGKTVTAPEAPSVPGYRFTGWSQSLENIQGDCTFTAQYEPIPTYTVTYYDNLGTLLKTETVYENEKVTGCTVTPPEGYLFDAWLLGNETFNTTTKISKDLTLQASFKVNEALLTTPKKNLNKAETLSDKWEALLAYQAVLNLWTEDEQQALDLTSYTTAKTDYSTIQTQIEQDLMVLEQLMN